MRKISILTLIAALTFGSYACGDDDDDTPVKKEDPQENTDDKGEKKDDPKDNNGEPGDNNGEPSDNGNGEGKEATFSFQMPRRTIYYANDDYLIFYLNDISSAEVTLKIVDESGAQVEASIEKNGNQCSMMVPAQVGTFYVVATSNDGQVLKSSPFSCISTQYTSIMTDLDKPYIDLENGVAMDFTEASANPSKVTLVVENRVGLVSPSVCVNETISANGNSIEFDGKSSLEDTGFTKQFKLSNGKEGLITFMSISRNFDTGDYQNISFNYSFK